MPTCEISDRLKDLLEKCNLPKPDTSIKPENLNRAITIEDMD